MDIRTISLFKLIVNVICLSWLVSISNADSDYKDAVPRFEYKMSFKGPHLIQSDGAIPFWSHGGS